MSLLGICLAWAGSTGAAATPPVFVPAPPYTLAWTHSVERVRWEEDYRVVRDADGAPRLVLTEARVQGSAAGMEPPEDAVLDGGWYRYRPHTALPAVLRLTRSPYTTDYELCTASVPCQTMERWLPHSGAGEITLLWACESAGQSRRSPARGTSG